MPGIIPATYRNQLQFDPKVEKQLDLCETLKRLGFSREKQIRLYGSQFELVGDPIVMSESVVFIDGVERKSGLLRRVRIPLTIVNMAAQQIETTYAA